MNMNQTIIREPTNHTCCFFGHRDIVPSVRESLQQAIETLIRDGKADHFYVGNQGSFDRMAYEILKEMAIKYPHIRYNVVLAYRIRKKLKDDVADHAIYPARLDTLSKYAAIPYRNEWMIDNSQYVICYVARTIGGTAKFVNQAREKGLTVININS